MKDLLQNIWQSFWDALRPDGFYAWQTALWMSLLAWLMAQAARSPEQVNGPITVHGILTSFSWMFLILAVGWLTTEQPLRLFGQNIGPWLTGSLVCLFLFVRRDYALPEAALITWPLISTAIAAFPEFVNIDSGFSIPRNLKVRQRLCILLLCNLLLTSWILFSFRLQDWLNDYPGIQGEYFENSFFLAEPLRDGRDFSRGTAIVEEMKQQLAANTNQRSKAQVERWLFDNQRSPQIFRDSVMNALAEADQRRRDELFWQLETRVSEPAYQVLLRAHWKGPRPDVEGHVVEQSCRIDFSNPDRRAQVFCQDGVRLPSEAELAPTPEEEVAPDGEIGPEAAVELPAGEGAAVQPL